MKPKKKVEEAIRTKLRFTAGATLRDRLLTDVMNARDEFKGTRPVLYETGIRRRIMRSPIARLTSLAAVFAVAALSMLLWSRFSTSAYAIEDTYKALQNVRFLHIIERDEAGQVKDERWIEIGEDGWQVRYRQDNPAPRNFGVIEDGEFTAVYRHEKKAVVIYDRKEMQYQWVGELGKAFENLRQEGKILQDISEYQGRPAHKVWWPYMSAECYVDPETKLPMAIGDTELSYEQPPAGTFEITVPDGYAMLDKRPGAAPGPVPDWLLAEENAEENRRKSFEQGTIALIQGDYAEAARQFEQALEYDSWATFWLGSAYYGLGQYDQAAEYFGKMLKDFGGDNKPVPFCNYALGLAQAQGGHHEAATVNFHACLPAMIQTLRIPSGGRMFEYADNPKMRYGQYKPGEQEMVANMINRLRIVTGQNFGYDPAGSEEQNEAAVAAWEQWFKTDGQIRFTPDSPQIEVPAEWVNRLGWGRKSNQEIATRYTPQWGSQIGDPGALLKVGFALYDAKRYDEALEAFEKLEANAGDSQRRRAAALIWQGHMLDLLGRREEATSRYRAVANMALDAQIEHSQYGLSYDYSAYAQERALAPFVRVENRDEN